MGMTGMSVLFLPVEQRDVIAGPGGYLESLNGVFLCHARLSPWNRGMKRMHGPRLQEDSVMQQGTQFRDWRTPTVCWRRGCRGWGDPGGLAGPLGSGAAGTKGGGGV